MRSYREADESQRDIERSGIEIKNFHYYNRQDNLWNEQSRLDPVIAKYCHKNIDPNTSFKQTIRDLPKLEEQEREEKFTNKFNKLMQIRQELSELYQNRKLERMVQQYQCSQQLTDEEIQEIKRLEDENPALFDEI